MAHGLTVVSSAPSDASFRLPLGLGSRSLSSKIRASLNTLVSLPRSPCPALLNSSLAFSAAAPPAPEAL